MESITLLQEVPVHKRALVTGLQLNPASLETTTIGGLMGNPKFIHKQTTKVSLMHIVQLPTNIQCWKEHDPRRAIANNS